jgi:hypothetical protein
VTTDPTALDRVPGELPRPARRPTLCFIALVTPRALAGPVGWVPADVGRLAGVGARVPAVENLLVEVSA